YKAAKPAWTLLEEDVIAWPEPPADLSTEISKVKSLKPDVIAPICRPASAQLLLPEIRKQRIEMVGIVSPGSPGVCDAGAREVLPARGRQALRPHRRLLLRRRVRHRRCPRADDLPGGPRRHRGRAEEDELLGRPHAVRGQHPVQRDR